MKKFFKKATAAVMTVALSVGGSVATSTDKIDDVGAASSIREHVIGKGESDADNPLKGMLGYKESSNFNFPHSMEWFYIPVSAVQTGMNTFDWSALERELNDVASRGHQSVFRFYYDYPGEGNGVPQFVKDHGLTMKYYNEPADLGGSGYAPDYEDAYFRQSMQSFIAEFGRQYDGDGRIGFVTIGLLGFWGEWHNWPYDEDTSDGKPDWSISTTVYKEVLDAFDAAFDKTKICVREPKDGIDFTKYNVGYHDDSFGYATLSQSNGGQDWSFMQKLKNARVNNKWSAECVGGEIYPPSQGQIFSGKSGDYQDWTKCQNEAHATWMLNESIKSYSGTNYTNALSAAKSLGYDLQTDKAYFPDSVNKGDYVQLSVEMRNIGKAPFYYDHNIWPVQVGLKSGNNVTVVGTTTWDLNTIPADGNNKQFDYNFNANLNPGQYKMCIRVKNPIATGKNISFANTNQDSNGWLELGDMTIDEKQEVQTTTAEPQTTKNEPETTKPNTDNNTHESYAAWQDNDYIYVNVPIVSGYENTQIYIDSDNNNQTGYLNSNGGFEYLVENGSIYRHKGNNGDWSYETVNSLATVTEQSDYRNYKFKKSDLGITSEEINIMANLVDSSWNNRKGYEIITAHMEETAGGIISKEPIIEGFQISYLGKGLRTVYTTKQSYGGLAVTEVGLVYALEIDKNNEDEMVVGSTSNLVKSYRGTEEKGRQIGSRYETEDTRCYAMTMCFSANNAAEFNERYYVRAYAKLSDGSYVYSPVSDFSVYDIADKIMTGRQYNSYDSYNYLLNSILKVANPDYGNPQY
ncbi:MAG: DUF4832 domain-containing protein [Lachnospiraceae bacterium]|nr:DUF4832 domain-containing protein [Lachnospiraceae bacterium]